jgi:hypothetical protein
MLSSIPPLLLLLKEYLLLLTFQALTHAPRRPHNPNRPRFLKNSANFKLGTFGTNGTNFVAPTGHCKLAKPISKLNSHHQKHQ